MSTSVQPGAPLYPPRVKPSAKPLRFPFNLTHLLNDNLTLIPEQAYHDDIVIVPGPPRMAFISGSAVLETLLMNRPSEFPKGRLQNETLRPLFGNAMISSEGREWRWQRGAAAPLFRYEELLQYGPIMSDSAEAAVAKWRAAPPGTIHTVNNDMMHAAFQVISKTMLVGGAPDAIHAIEQGHADYYRGVNWWALYVLFGFPHWLPRPGGRLMRAQERRLRRVFGDLVKARRSAARGGDDLLGRMVSATDPETGRKMSDELVVDNVLAFLMAGYDTTAFSLTWTLYLISQSPQWEARMIEEIDRVVGAEPVTAAHVKKLEVVQQVLNESLRLYPTAPVIIRDINESVELGGITIPAGTIGIIPIYAIHRHRSHWDDPDRFDPDRFSPERPTKPSRYQFMPFGAGPRVCMGASFAMIEATIMLATFVRAARFEVVPGFDPQPIGRMFLIPKHGMPMRVTLR